MSIFSREKYDLKRIASEIHKEDSTIKKAMHKGYISNRDFKDIQKHKINEEKLKLALEKDFDRAIHKKRELSKELLNVTKPIKDLVKIASEHKGESRPRNPVYYRTRKWEIRLFKDAKKLNLSIDTVIKTVEELDKLIKSQVLSVKKLLNLENLKLKELLKEDYIIEESKRVDTYHKENIRIDKKEVSLNKNESGLWQNYARYLTSEFKNTSKDILPNLKKLKNLLNNLKNATVKHIKNLEFKEVMEIRDLSHTLILELESFEKEIDLEKGIIKKLEKFDKSEKALDKVELKHIK